MWKIYYFIFFWKIAYLSVFWNQNLLYEANFIIQSNVFLLHLFEGAYLSLKKVTLCFNL